jgi:hypothetical protein
MIGEPGIIAVNFFAGSTPGQVSACLDWLRGRRIGAYHQ